jgi:PAS domain S-box-containing protein
VSSGTIQDLSPEQRLSLLVEAVIDYALFMLEPDGTVVSWNSGAHRLKGYQADEIIGQNFSRFFTEEDLARNVPAQTLQAATEVGRHETEGWRVRKDGSRFWALAVLDAIRGQDGRLLGFVKITRDTTERRKAQQQLIASERRFRQLVEGVVDYAIFSLDPNGHVATWNTGAQRIKGYTPEDIIGRHFSAFYTPEDQEAATPANALATAAREGKYEAEGWRVRKDGSRFFASVVIDASATRRASSSASPR